MNGLIKKMAWQKKSMVKDYISHKKIYYITKYTIKLSLQAKQL